MQQQQQKPPSALLQQQQTTADRPTQRAPAVAVPATPPPAKAQLEFLKRLALMAPPQSVNDADFHKMVRVRSGAI